MQRITWLPVLLVGGSLGLAACGGGGTGVGDELRNARDIRAEQAVEGVDGSFGEPVDLGVVTVTVSDPRVGGDESSPWLVLNVRVENHSDEAVDFIDAGIWCAGNDEGGGWLANSTLNLNAGIPAKSFDEGTLYLLLPGDARVGGAYPECEAPASVVISPAIGFMSGEPAVWALPSAIVSELNDY